LQNSRKSTTIEGGEVITVKYGSRKKDRYLRGIGVLGLVVIISRGMNSPSGGVVLTIQLSRN